MVSRNVCVLFVSLTIPANTLLRRLRLEHQLVSIPTNDGWNVWFHTETGGVK